MGRAELQRTPPRGHVTGRELELRARELGVHPVGGQLVVREQLGAPRGAETEDAVAVEADLQTKAGQRRRAIDAGEVRPGRGVAVEQRGDIGTAAVDRRARGDLGVAMSRLGVDHRAVPIRGAPDFVTPLVELDERPVLAAGVVAPLGGDGSVRVVGARQSVGNPVSGLVLPTQRAVRVADADRGVGRRAGSKRERRDQQTSNAASAHHGSRPRSA
jgi:hypothetical protein